MQVTIKAVERLKNSYVGNPTYKIFTNLGNFVTVTNGGNVYGFEYMRLETGAIVDIELDKKGKIEDIKLITK